MRLSQEDHARIAAAIAEAEAAGGARIQVVVAGRSDPYHDAGLHYAVLAMVLVPVAFALVPAPWLACAMNLLPGGGGEPGRGVLMTGLFVLLVLAFLAVRYLLAWMKLRLALTPASTKARRVRRRAAELFRAGIGAGGHPAVLIYVSRGERRVEVLGMEAGELESIASELTEALKQGRLSEGLIAGIGRIAARLPAAGSLPATAPDRVVEL